MNKELKGREYNLPPDIIKHLNSQLQISSTDTVGTNRAKELIQSSHAKSFISKCMRNMTK